MQEVVKSQYKLMLMMRFELICALSADDLNGFAGKKNLDEVANFYRAHAGEAVSLIDNMSASLIRTGTVSVKDRYDKKIIKPKYPKLFSKIFDWTTTAEEKGDDVKFAREEQREDDIYISKAEIGFSFGSNTHLFRYLIPKLLLKVKAKLRIYMFPDEFRSYRDLILRVGKHFSFIECYSIDKHQFSHSELKQCHEAKDCAEMTNILARQMNDTLDTGIVIRGGKSIKISKPDSFSADESTNKLMRYASKIILKKGEFHELYICKKTGIFERIDFTKPIVLLITRDSAWTGPGQPWRDSHIETYKSTIDYLIEKDYSVVRLNSTGTSSKFQHKNFLDLVSIDQCSPNMQLEIISQAHCVIGADTGLTGFAQIAGGLPTLAINHPDITGHSPWSKLLMRSKNLTVDNEKKYDLSLSKGRLIELLRGTEKWTHETLASHGLRLWDLSDYEIKQATIEFLRCIKDNNWNLKKRSSQIKLTGKNRSDILLADQTFCNLKNLLRM